MGRSGLDVGKIPGVLALAMAAGGVGWGIGSIEAEHHHHAAVDLLDRGRPLTVHDVEVHLSTWRGRTSVDGVRVHVGGRDGGVRTELVGAGEPVDDGDLPDGWQSPFRGSSYSAPLEILVAPDDVDLAMAVEDVEAYRTSALPEDMTISGGLLAGSLLVLLARWRWRPRGGGRTRGHHGR